MQELIVVSGFCFVCLTSTPDWAITGSFMNPCPLDIFDDAHAVESEGSCIPSFLS